MVSTVYKPTDEEFKYLVKKFLSATMDLFADSVSAGLEPASLALYQEHDAKITVIGIELENTSIKRQEQLFLLGRSLKDSGRQIQAFMTSLLSWSVALKPGEDMPKDLSKDARRKEIVSIQARTHDGRQAVCTLHTGRLQEQQPMNYGDPETEFFPDLPKGYEAKLVNAFWNGYHYQPPNAA
jgi:hypothetical protein